MAEIIDFTPDFPDVEDMDLEDLRRYWKIVEDRIEALDAEEPEDMDSEEYDQWADLHEELEDLREEIEERLEEFGE